MKMESCIREVSKKLKISEQRVRNVIMSDTFIDEDGSVELKNGGQWYQGRIFKSHINSKPHSINDEPSYINLDAESKFLWHKAGIIHRDTKFKNGRVKPAHVIYGDERAYTLEWYKNGKLHNSDKDKNGRLLPAVFDTLTLPPGGVDDIYGDDIDDDDEFVPYVEYWIDGKQIGENSGYDFAVPKINIKELKLNLEPQYSEL
jgi:hypothetical protein